MYRECDSAIRRGQQMRGGMVQRLKLLQGTLIQTVKVYKSFTEE